MMTFPSNLSLNRHSKKTSPKNVKIYVVTSRRGGKCCRVYGEGNVAVYVNEGLCETSNRMDVVDP